MSLECIDYYMYLLWIIAVFMGSGWVGQASQTAKECYSEQRRNQTMLCACHNDMQFILPTMHVTNLNL